MTTLTVKQGETVALSYSANPEQDLTAWTCRAMVKSKLSEAALIDESLTILAADTFSYSGLIDTASLAVGCYHLVAELANATSGENAEIHDQLHIEEQGVF